LEGWPLYRVSVDVGGTFTDLVAMDQETGEVINIKVPTVPRSPEKGVVDAFVRFLQDVSPESIGMVGHATTIATNALFGQVDLELPRTALVTTKGFRDVIEIGRQRRAEVYNLFFSRPPMLVERRHRYEVEERIDYRGRILKPLSEDDLDDAIEAIRSQGVESVAIGFINSYRDGRHEEEALRVMEEALPGIHLTASSRISSGYREYERFSTAVVNAALTPIIKTYVSSIASHLRALGVGSPFYVMQSNGGMATALVVSERPATIVESGPASGVIASAWLGGIMERDRVISFDMGGTTAKAGTVRGRVPEVVQECEVAGKVHMGRLLKGSGYPVRFPFIDLAECSAGGGTIAWADGAGALNVGPLSAGAAPGPICYGKGGEEPTITDANLALGRLNPRSLLGGGMKIYPEKAEAALDALGEAVGLSSTEAAASIVKIANSMMSKILRMVSVERGFDPRGFSLIAFGGAGPMHACPLAEELEIDEILVPVNPGMFSALGLLAADLFHDHSRALVTRTDEVDPDEVQGMFTDMEEEGRETLKTEGVGHGSMRFMRQLDLRYLGQSYEITVEAADPFDKRALGASIDSFHKRHREIYGYGAEEESVEFVSVRLRAVGLIPKPRLRESEKIEGPSDPGSRSIFFETAGEWVETPIHDRVRLGVGFSMSGPAIIEQYDSTTVVYPGWRVEVDRLGILGLRRDG